MPEGNLHGSMSGAGALGAHMQGSGTTDYNALNNKPKINNITLVGNKTSDDLNLQNKINFPGDGSKYLDGEGNFTTPAGSGGSYSGLTDKPSINGVELNGNKSLSDLDIQEELDFPNNPLVFLNGEGNFVAIFVNYDNIANRPSINGHTLTGNQTSDDLDLQDKLPFDSNPNKYLNGAGSFTEVTGDYSNLSNKPSIGGVELDGDKSAAQLGLQRAITYPGDPDVYLNGQGNFTTPSAIKYYGSATGNPAILPDGTAGPFDSCECDIVAAQDLHGYSKPWAGGAGKNKIPLTVNDIKDLNTGFTWIDNTFTYNGVTVTLETDADGNLTKIATSGICSANFSIKLAENLSMTSGTYVLNGCNNGNTSTYYFQGFGNIDYTSGAGILEPDGETPFTLTATNNLIIRLHFRNTADMTDVELYPMIRVSGESSDFEPYTNICPISGYDASEINVSPSSDPGEGTTVTISFDETIYGGHLDVLSGELIITHGYIASYNSEVLPGAWISSEDEYIEGNNPTVGAEVVYELAAPTSDEVTGAVVDCLAGVNYVSCDTGDVTVVYVRDVQLALNYLFSQV